jgi:hypothetical protein
MNISKASNIYGRNAPTGKHVTGYFNKKEDIIKVVNMIKN